MALLFLSSGLPTSDQQDPSLRTPQRKIGEETRDVVVEAEVPTMAERMSWARLQVSMEPTLDLR
jgi:hypothetical protein